MHTAGVQVRVMGLYPTKYVGPEMGDETGLRQVYTV